METAQAKMLLVTAREISKRIDKLATAVNDNNVDLVEDWVDLILDGDERYRRLAAMALELMLMPISASSIAASKLGTKEQKQRLLSLQNLPHREELEELLLILKAGVRPGPKSRSIKQLVKILLESSKVKHHILHALSSAAKKLNDLSHSPKLGQISSKLENIPSDVVDRLQLAMQEKDWVTLFHIVAQDLIIPWIPEMVHEFSPKRILVESDNGKTSLELSEMDLKLPQAPSGASVSVGEHSQFKRSPLYPTKMEPKEEWVSLSVQSTGIDIQIDSAKFVFQKKTFPKVHLTGHLECAATDVVLDTHLRIPVPAKGSPTDDVTRILQVDRGTCSVGNMVIKLAKDVKHSRSLNKLLELRHSKLVSELNTELQAHFAEVLEKHITALNLLLLHKSHLVDPLIGTQMETSCGTGMVFGVDKQLNVAKVELNWNIPGIRVTMHKALER